MQLARPYPRLVLRKDPHAASYQPCNNFFQRVYAHPQVVAGMLRVRLSEKLLGELAQATLQQEPQDFLPSAYRSTPT